MTESLFVMASHGVLLEYTLETLPDVNNKDNICESSPIKLQVCPRFFMPPSLQSRVQVIGTKEWRQNLSKPPDILVMRGSQYPLEARDYEKLKWG